MRLTLPHADRGRPILAAMLGSSIVAASSVAGVLVGWVAPTGGVSIATDSADNVYTVNYEFNPGGDIHLTKRDSSGAFVWQTSFNQTLSSAWEKATWVATDHEDNVLVAGSLMSGISNPVNAASILMKFNGAGELLWRVVYESSFDGSSTRRCLVDADNNVYVLGLGSGPNGFVTKVKKFAPDGTALWSYFDEAGIGAPLNFKLTPDNHILIIARGIIGSINGYAKITLDGENVWSKAGVQSLTVGDAAGDSSGNTYLVHGEYVLNPTNSVVKKLDPSGTLIWEELFPLTAFRVEVGTDERPVLCGFPNPNMGGAAFVKVDEGGGVVWQNLDADGPSLALLLHAQLLIDESNSVYLAAGTLFEMAVCKVGADGTSAWTATTPGGYANAITFGHQPGRLFVIGGTTARLNESPAVLLGDLDGDGLVNGADITMVLGSWGPCAGCASDLNGDGVLDGGDIAILLGNWTG